ncbi:MAG: hypothetical protein AAFO83_00105 [Cyanobacteria bacterium J06607_13]
MPNPHLTKLAESGQTLLEVSLVSPAGLVNAGQTCRVILPGGQQVDAIAQTPINSNRVQIAITDDGQALAWCQTAPSRIESSTPDLMRFEPEPEPVRLVFGVYLLYSVEDGGDRIFWLKTPNREVELLSLPTAKSVATNYLGTMGGNDYYAPPGTDTSGVSAVVNSFTTGLFEVSGEVLGGETFVMDDFANPPPHDFAFDNLIAATASTITQSFGLQWTSQNLLVVPNEPFTYLGVQNLYFAYQGAGLSSVTATTISDMTLDISIFNGDAITELPAGSPPPSSADLEYEAWLSVGAGLPAFVTIKERYSDAPGSEYERIYLIDVDTAGQAVSTTYTYDEAITTRPDNWRDLIENYLPAAEQVIDDGVCTEFYSTNNSANLATYSGRSYLADVDLEQVVGEGTLLELIESGEGGRFSVDVSVFQDAPGECQLSRTKQIAQRLRAPSQTAITLETIAVLVPREYRL